MFDFNGQSTLVVVCSHSLAQYGLDMPRLSPSFDEWGRFLPCRSLCTAHASGAGLAHVDCACLKGCQSYLRGERMLRGEIHMSPLEGAMFASHDMLQMSGQGDGLTQLARTGCTRHMC